MKNNLTTNRILTPILLALLLCVGAGNAFGIDPNVHYRITAKHSGRCLSGAGTRFTDNGAEVVQRDCIDADLSQQWQIIPVDNFYYKIIARHSTKALDVRGGVGRLGDGEVVHQWDYVGAANQNWRLIPLSDGYYQIIASHSGKSLQVNVGQGVIGNGAAVQQWVFLGGNHQRWRLTELGPVDTSSAPAVGRFRVTLTGFVVNRPTVDGVLIGDGRGDEVYAAIQIAELSSLGLVQPIRELVSLTYGDISASIGSSRVKAGDIDPAMGGLQAGNSYPGPGDSPQQSDARSIPMILWEGELRRGPNENVLVILPTIWETDNDPIMLGHWMDHTRNVLTNRSGSQFRSRHGSFVTAFQNFSDAMVERVDHNDFDHPIGIQGDAFVPFVTGEARFNPWSMLLTFDSAEAAANSTANSALRGRGLVGLPYEDGERYGKGRYTIFLRVDRLR